MSISLENGQSDQDGVSEDPMVHYARALERALNGKYRNIQFVHRQHGCVVFFRAHKIDIDTEVLIKTVFPYFSSARRKALENEANILGKVSIGSMPVVWIYEFFPDLRVDMDPESKDQCSVACLVMADIAGISLAELMKYLEEHRSGQMVPHYLAAGIGHWLASVYAILHGNYRCLAHSEKYPSVGHGDISAANVQIAISKVNTVATPVLIDFGNVTPFRHDMPSGGITLFYISPEWYSRKWSPQSEIFSLAVLIYVLCTGRHPYGGIESLRYLWEIFLNEPQEQLPEPDMLSHFDSEFADILRSALSINPDKRPRTMADFAYSLWDMYIRNPNVHGNLPVELDRYLQSIGIIDANRVQSIRGKLAADTAKIISVP